MSPRPILKTNDVDNSVSPFPFASSSRILDSPRVHFPPTPTLTTTEITHSPFIYDRAPIDVTPNTCALPERGDRKYVAVDMPRCHRMRINQSLDAAAARNTASSSHGDVKGSYFHPRAYEAVEHERDVQQQQPLSGTSLLFSAAYNRYEFQTRCPTPLSLDPELDPYASSASDSSSRERRSPSPAISIGVGVSISPTTMTMTISSSSAGSSSLSTHSYPFIPDTPCSPSRRGGDADSGKDAAKRIKKKKPRDFYRTTQLLNPSCSTSGFYESVDGCLGGF